MKKLIPMLSVLILPLGAYAQSGAKAKTVVKEETKSLEMAQVSQKKIDRLSEQTSDLLLKYRQTLRQIENAKVYNNQLREIIKTQDLEKVSVAAQIEELKDTNKGIVPLMVSMVENMEAFVSLDIPFLPQEREKRVSDLKSLLSRADTSTSEKFRQILEAYQVENEYGRTIEAYRGIKKKGDNEMTVDYLRIGRVALIYQSLDAKEAALWNPKTKSWDELGSEYRKSIQAGLKMARKQTAPQLIKMPLFAAGGQ